MLFRSELLRLQKKDEMDTALRAQEIQHRVNELGTKQKKDVMDTAMRAQEIQHRVNELGTKQKKDVMDTALRAREIQHRVNELGAKQQTEGARIGADIAKHRKDKQHDRAKHQETLAHQMEQARMNAEQPKQNEE